LDVVAKLSRRIGIAHEALLGLQHAASLAGVSAEALNKSLEIFVRRMGEVKSGSGEAKRGLEALGLSAERMIKLTPEKALLVIADRIQELGTQAEKSAAAYFLFGRSGAQLLNLFEQGADAIERTTEAARRAGITLEGFDLSKIEAANDAWNNMEKSVRSLGQELVIGLAPKLEVVANILSRIFGGDPFASDGRAPFESLEPTAGFKRMTENLKTIEGINKEIERSQALIRVMTQQQERLDRDMASGLLEAHGLRVDGLDRQKEMLTELEKRLSVMTKEKKLAESVAVAEKNRLDTMSKLIAMAKAEARNIITNVFDKLPGSNRTEVETGPGRFQQIRSAFIDVAALNPVENKQLQLSETRNRLLEELNRNAMGVHSA
jgi:hypothetical protein